MNNSLSKKEDIHTNQKKIRRGTKKKSFLFWILKLLILIALLLFLLWQFSHGDGFLNLYTGSAQPTFQQDLPVQPDTPPLEPDEEFLIITVIEDEIYLDNTLISLEDLKDYLSEMPVNQRIQLEDEKALYRVFNEVKTLLDDSDLVYMID